MDMSEHKRLEAAAELAKQNTAPGGCVPLAEQLDEDTKRIIERLARPPAERLNLGKEDRGWALRQSEQDRMLELLWGDYPPIELRSWLRMEAFTSIQALPLICGFCLDDENEEGGWVRLDGLRLFDDRAMRLIGAEQVEYMRRSFKKKLRELERLWDSRNIEDKPRPLCDFISWAQGKGYVIDWLDWANQSGFPDIMTTSDVVGIFDVNDPNYPRLLHVAFQAWTAVSGSFVEGKPKPQIERWLRTEHPQLSSSAFDAIALICNWDKRGGRPPTST